MSEKRKVGFNFVDFLIIIAVIAALFSIMFRSTLLKLIGNAVYTQDTTITVRISGLTVEQADAVSVGDVLYLSDEKFGKISDVTKTASTQMALSGGEDRKFIGVSDERHYDLVCKVEEVRGVYNDDGFYLFGEQHLGVGKEISLSSEIYRYNVIVVSIS